MSFFIKKEMNNLNYYAVIMAGGVGSRFWPVSTSKYPKQFQDMMGVGETLIQLTYNRLASLVPHENIYILTNAAYREVVKEQLPKVNEEQLILEPVMRNTAPCILLAALKIREKNPEAVMLVAPSDHWIIDKEAFSCDIQNAFQAAEKSESLITLGVKPTFPNTGYGYIRYKEDEKEGTKFNLHKVEKFTEKPTLRNARKYLEEGSYAWNAGIFVWKVTTIIDAFQKHMEDMFRLFENGRGKFNNPEEEEFIKEVYPTVQNISVDYGILEKSENVFVIPASFDWDDLGTWGALYSKLAKDEFKNAVVNARLVPQDSANNIIYTHSPKIVVLDGMDDFIIIDDKDVLLIVPKEKEQEIKNIRAKALESFDENLG